MKNIKVANALLPFMLLGTPAMAVGSSVRSGSRFRVKKAVVQSSVKAKPQAIEKEAFKDPFGVFGSSKTGIKKAKETQADVLAFLKEENLLDTTGEKKSLVSGERKIFAGTFTCYPGATHNGFSVSKLITNPGGGGSSDYATFYNNNLYIAMTTNISVFPTWKAECQPPANTAPTLGGTFTTAGAVNDNTTIAPFSGVTVADADADNVSITITYTAANGTLTGTGVTGSAGSYTVTSAAPATATANLQALVFTPSANQVAPASTVVTTFTLTPNDGTVDGTADATTQVTVTSINDTPTDIALSSASVNQSGGANAVVGTLSNTDADTGQTYTYSLVAGTGDTDNASFNISTTSLQANDASALAAGTYAVRLNVNDGVVNFEKAFTVTVVDDVLPTLSTLSPLDNAIDISTTSNLVITLSENVLAGTGNIVIYDSANTAIETIPVGDARVTISGAAVTINPTATLAISTSYYVQIAATALTDTVGNAYAGITDTTSWSFTTVSNLSPTITGAVASQAVNDNATLAPFNAVTLADNESNNLSITITLDDNAKGVLSGTGLSGSGPYTISSDTIANVQVILRALTFNPTDNRVVPASTETTTFSIVANDGTSDSLTNNTTTVISTSINDAPTIDTTFSDIVIMEDNGTASYDLNVSDIDSADLNITVDSNDTSILVVTQNWINALNQAAWTQTQDFNLTTQANANGVVRVTITTFDEDKNATRSFDVNVSAVNDSPVLNSIANQTKAEDFGDFNLTLSASDVDDVNLTYAAFSNDTSKATLNVVGNQLVISSVLNANGLVTIDMNVTDGELSHALSFDLNVTAVDDAPTLDPIATQTQAEDFTDLNITLTSNDIEGNPITYTVGSSNTSIATVSIVNGKIVLTPIANATGVTTIEVNATANSLTATQTFDLSITGVNDAPTIDTTFANIQMQEDDGTTNYELNVSDVDGDDLSITVESSDTGILQVTPNWTNLVNQAAWTQTLDFNLTAVPNANGIVSISVTVNDGEFNSLSSFDVNISAVSDAPTIAYLPDRIYYKNFTDKNITVEGTDVDGQALTYSANILTADILNSVTVTGNTMTISSLSEASGFTDVNVSVTDGDFNVSQVFNIQVLTIAADSDVTEEASATVETVDANGTTFSNTIGTDILIERREENNATVSHTMKIGTTTTQARSDINGSVVQITGSGVQTKYLDANVTAEVNATVTGQASSALTANAIVVKALIEAIGASTVMSKDTNGSVEIVTSIVLNGETIVITAKEDGTAEHTAEVNGVTSKASSTVPGATTTVKADGKVETSIALSSETIAGNVWVFEAVAKTDTTGATVTVFQKRNTTTNAVESVQNTFKPQTPYNPGNRVVIEVINGKTYFKTTASITTDMIVE